MSLKKVEQAKQDRGFRKGDLIVYGVLALLIAVMFFAVFFTRDTRPLQGVGIYVDNALVLEYDFAEDEAKSLSETVEILRNDGERLTVKVVVKGGYNILEFDKAVRSVTVTDADCGSRDCVAMRDITDNSGIIYCSPHRLTILPVGYDPDSGYIPV